MGLPLEKQVTVKAFPEHDVWFAEVPELAAVGFSPSGWGPSPEAARQQLFSSVRALRHSPEIARKLAESAKGAVEGAQLTSEPGAVTESLTLGELYQRSGVL